MSFRRRRYICGRNREKAVGSEFSQPRRERAGEVTEHQTTTLANMTVSVTESLLGTLNHRIIESKGGHTAACRVVLTSLQRTAPQKTQANSSHRTQASFHWQRRGVVWEDTKH